jgi:hypothetical protein
MIVRSLEDSTYVFQGVAFVNGVQNGGLEYLGVCGSDVGMREYVLR